MGARALVLGEEEAPGWIAGSWLRKACRDSNPWSSSVQGSAVFRLPSDLTPGPQRPPGCAAMVQLSSRCQINEPTSG